MDWSPFLRGRFIAAISGTSQIYIWDLEAKEDVGAPLIVLNPSGQSPAVTISWLADYEVCVSFRAKMLKVFDINSGDCILAEQTTRTAGARVATQPVCFNGLLAYDTHFVNIVDVMNTMSAYIAFNRDDDSAIVVPTFNSHQVQACRSRICQRTGAIGSVGADGRLVWSINGRIVARGETMDYTFACARPALHLVRRQKAAANVDDTGDKVLLSHEECCEGSWLEVRLGDSALKDQDSVKRNKLKLPEILLDRRVESLTFGSPVLFCGCTPVSPHKSATMDAIKKKMQAMKIEKDNALDRADAAEEKVRQITEKLERTEEELRDTQKKMMQTENDLDKAQEDLAQANGQLEEKEKKVQEAEAEVASLNRRMTLLEEELERAEERLKIATEKMEEASANCDESERVRKVMENRSLQDEERANAVEEQLKEAQALAEEADRKYDEVARKLAMVEADLERAEERAEAGENKIVELEEELRVVGNNLKSLELSEEKALEREETYEEQIRQLDTRLKEAETRAEFAERSVQKLQKEVDRLEDELVHEKERYKSISEELDQTFQELSGY
ncbi:tropomyosin [Aphelenchoides avenae]|nr:tropomyosin [Aphelenchus avenae]